MRCVAVVLGSLVVTVAAGQPPAAPLIPKEDRAKIVARLSEEFRAEKVRTKAEQERASAALKAAKLQLAGAEAGKVVKGTSSTRATPGAGGKVAYTFPTEDDKQKSIEQARQLIAKHEAMANYPDAARPDKFGALIGGPKVGVFGRVDDYFRADRVVRIIDDNTCVAALNFFGKKVDVVIRGVETKGLADAASPTPPGMYYVRGTVMLNNRTLFELVPFAPTPEEVAAIAAPPKQ